MPITIQATEGLFTEDSGQEAIRGVTSAILEANGARTTGSPAAT